MGKKINVHEVGPRDGFQNLKCEMLATEEKTKIIDLIVGAGVKHMEHTSFVSPKAIPQLADAADVTRYCMAHFPDLDFYPLVPNMRGAQNAYDLGLRKVCYVASLSKSHNKANINRTHEESLAAFREIKSTYPDLEIELDLATTFGCPFEGKFNDPQMPVDFLKGYVESGLRKVDLCDTIGIADPAQVEEYIKALMKAYPNVEFMVHFHDTRGLGMANTLTAIRLGIDNVQSTLGGLGGCPFAPGASGNLATEDVVWALNEMGYDTGINFESIVKAAKIQAEDIIGNYSGHHMNIEAITPCKY